MNDNGRGFAGLMPGVNLIFFASAVIFSAVLMNPFYQAVSIVSAITYYLILCKGTFAKAVKNIVLLIPFYLAITIITPLFNSRGERILFTYFGRNFTYESLSLGFSIAGMIISAALWFMCYSHVMTSDKFTAVFGNLIPNLSLLLVMIFRLVPMYRKKAIKISGTRMSVGKGVGESASSKESRKAAATVLSVLTGWALESSIVMADSMKSRGYGSGKRSNFKIYKRTKRDILSAIIIILLIVLTAVALAKGWTLFGVTAYALLLFMPSISTLWENITWNYLRSKI